MTKKNRILLALMVVGLVICSEAVSWAQQCSDSTAPGTFIGFTPLAGDIEMPNSCNLLPCYEPELTDGPSVVTDENCDALLGPCPVRARVALDFPGNSQMPTNTHARVYWFDQATPDEESCLVPPFGNCSPIAICGLLGAEILVDKGETWIQQGVSCADIASGAYQQRSFSIGAYACQTFSGECTERLDVPGIELPSPEDLWDLLECDPPPPPCKQCPCNIGGGGCGGSVGGGSAFCKLDGPGAFLRYQARGAGHPDFPGSVDWNTTLGRYWSHDYAERIVLDPDEGDENHVWLITREAGFHEFTGLVGGVYQGVMPSDEHRQLSRTAVGWRLSDLDGKVQTFDASGLWINTMDRNGNTTTGTYTDGKLSSVSFPDGRGETFSYHPDGKLATISEVGVDGVTSRTWSYTWSGPDLVRIDRPDGTARSFRYDDPRHPGYMTRITLMGNDGGERVESARQYDERGNVARTWKGDASFAGPDAVEIFGFGYDNPFRPTVTAVTDPLGNTTTYEVERDPGGVKPRVTQVSGGCSTCGVGPNTQQFYDDPQNPLRVTRSIDARGTATLFEYDGNGQRISRTEAFMTDLERTTTWEYDDTYPGLVASIQRPSTSGTGVRMISWTFDPEGNATIRTEEGVENAAPFSLDTTSIFNSAGRLESVDPPGFGTQDRITFSYATNPLIMSSRTSPIIGTTLFEYDQYNRRSKVTDVNFLVTETTYDSMDRVTSVTRKGASVAEDLVTTYQYNNFGDLLRIILPAGNIVEYGYDLSGRRVSIERKPDLSTQGDQIFYVLNDFGQQIREESRVWTGSSWEVRSHQDFDYSSGCQLDRVIHADGSVTEYSYDCMGNLDQEWDANHPSNNQQNIPTKTYGFDRLNRLESVSMPWGGSGGGSASIQYGYDVQSHLTKVIDENGTVTNYIYSDRDLLTQETSEVAGTTAYTYNEHRRRVGEVDSRNVAVTREYDVLDRVTLEDHPATELDIVYTYDDPTVSFSKGRLTNLRRGGEDVPFGYDRYGHQTRDGDLTYVYDKNGNISSIFYPGRVIASYTHDYANRPKSLSVQLAGGQQQTLVTSATYEPRGPLSSLGLGNGLVEARAHTSRYFPDTIQVPGLLSWKYTTDAVGNISAITDLIQPASSRAFGYQDYQYYLTLGTGPWGSTAWSYDKGGNRLTQARDGELSTYRYGVNVAGNNSPRLQRIEDDQAAPLVDFSYDEVGQLRNKVEAEGKVIYSYDSGRRLTRISQDTKGASKQTQLTYDGRSFLRRSVLEENLGDSTYASTTSATYSTKGLLYHRSLERSATPRQSRDQSGFRGNDFVFYFAGRPVAQLVERTSIPIEGAAEETTRTFIFMTTDHLGTPILATDISGQALWGGGFRPFGGDYSGASAAGVFLRNPGQWDDETWQEDSGQSGMFYNLMRWYQPGLGRYSRPDPLAIGYRLEANPYLYSLASPLVNMDPFGLVTSRDQCCSDCDDEKAQEELSKAFGWLLTRQKKYWVNPLNSDSCFDSASQLRDDLEANTKPMCWVTSVQLTPGIPLSGKYKDKDYGKEAFVHYVVKLSPCSGGGDDVFMDGYLGPKMGTLPGGAQLDETEDLLLESVFECILEFFN